MPELPEVETVAHHLRRILPNRRIEQASVSRPRLLLESTPEEFCQQLTGAVFTTIGRRGKHILIHLNTDQTLIVHLRMTGRFLYLEPGETLPKFTHAVFLLDNQKHLAFQDTRHFGMMHLVETSKLFETKELRDLAPEPLGPDFTVAYLSQTLRNTRRTAKDVLLDQTRVLGLGNIYAVEALFAARVHPQSPANALTDTQINELHSAIQMILEAAIEAGSTIHTDPETIDGKYFGNAFEEALTVYDREGGPCLRCDTPIVRIRQGQRSTYFCPSCQVLPE